MAEFSYFAFELPLAVIAATLFTAQVASRELGGWIRRHLPGSPDPSGGEATDKGFILSGVLGLLALLIAFTFSLSVARFETRRGLVIAEANAIGTAEMRVQLLGGPEGAKLAQMLRRYAETRLQFGQASATDKPRFARAAEAQRTALQTETLSALAPIRATPLAPFVGAAMNTVLDVGVERDTMLAARVPATVLVALGSYILLSAGVLGYALADSTARQRPATIILFALLTLAIVLILDLDRPQGGTVRTDQSPLVRLVAGFAAGANEPVVTRSSPASR